MQLFRVTYDRWFKDNQQNWDYDTEINYEYAITEQEVFHRYPASRRHSNIRVAPIDKTDPHYISWMKEFGPDVD